MQKKRKRKKEEADRKAKAEAEREEDREEQTEGQSMNRIMLTEAKRSNPMQGLAAPKEGAREAEAREGTPNADKDESMPEEDGAQRPRKDSTSRSRSSWPRIRNKSAERGKTMTSDRDAKMS